MSLKSILSRIWKSIKNLFAGIQPDMKTAIHTGVIVVENFKKLVDSPVADLLTAIIPGFVDDGIKHLLRARLPEILINLKLVDNCADIEDPDQLAACAIKTLQTIDGDLKSAYLHNLSIMVAQVAADGKLTWSDGVYLLEWYYQNKYKSLA